MIKEDGMSEAVHRQLQLHACMHARPGSLHPSIHPSIHPFALLVSTVPHPWSMTYQQWPDSSMVHDVPIE